MFAVEPHRQEPVAPFFTAEPAEANLRIHPPIGVGGSLRRRVDMLGHRLISVERIDLKAAF